MRRRARLRRRAARIASLWLTLDAWAGEQRTPVRQRAPRLSLGATR
jgi:hypothetical protein